MTSGVLSFKIDFKTVVSVDDAAIQVVQIGCRKSTAIQRNQRTQIRRNDRNARTSPSSPAYSSKRQNFRQSLSRFASFIRACIDFVLRSLSFRSTTRACRSSFSRDRESPLRPSWRRKPSDPHFSCASRYSLSFRSCFLCKSCATRIDDDIFFVIDDSFKISRGHAQEYCRCGTASF